MKKQPIVALALLLLIPLVSAAGGMLSNLINPEIAAGHPNYSRNFHLLSLLKMIPFWASGAVAAVLWLLVCLLLIRSKQRSYVWMTMAFLGPFGLIVLAMLNDLAPLPTDRYARFVRNLNASVRGLYELCTFALIWILAYEVMVLLRAAIIRSQALASGMSTAQIIDQQNASGGMWAFAEGTEVIFLVALFYLLRPIVFCIAASFLPSRKSA